MYMCIPHWRLANYISPATVTNADVIFVRIDICSIPSNTYSHITAKVLHLQIQTASCISSLLCDLLYITNEYTLLFQT